jgi:acyl-CoA synthetase (AMP-forming)/AMP-acid ligase II
MYIPLLVNDFLGRAIRQYGNKVAVVDGKKRFTYAQFGERVNRLSNGLLALGIRKGDRVAVIDINTHRLLEMYYAVPQIGAILLPINIRLTPKEISYVLNDSEAACLFLNEEMAPLFDRDSARSVSKIIILKDQGEDTAHGFEGEEYEALLAHSSPVGDEDFRLEENDPIEMFYTSGTTGKPKGMLLTHRMCWLAAVKDLFFGGVDDRTVYLQAVPLFHANSWRKPHTITAVCGRHVMLRRFRPEAVCELIQREKVNYFEIVPTMADTLIHFPDINQFDLSSVKRVVIGGAALSKATHDGLYEKFPNCSIYCGYGLSETASTGTTSSSKDFLDRLPEEKKKHNMRKNGFEDPVSRVRVVNDKGQDVKSDGQEVGEIIIRGHAVIDQYWRLPEETKSTLIGGWLYTGDMATVDENGYVEIVDRKKDIIISGGENIGSIEIEDVIRDHPSVLEVAVVSAPHEKWGETPAALVVLKEGQKLMEKELLVYCRQRLAGFKVPRVVEFWDSLPKGGTGKILKSKLKEKFWKGRNKAV